MNLNIPNPIDELIAQFNRINLANNMAFQTSYMKCVPNFNGDPDELQRFIKICEQIIDSFYDVANPNNFQNVYIINSIINKLEGNAQIIANINSCNNWVDLRNVLVRNFSDQRDESCLNRDLTSMRQKPTKTPKQFYERVLHTLNIICLYIDIHENIAANRILKRNLYQDLALKTFLAGLRDPLGTTIRTMRPNDLAEAIQFVNQEENISYFQNLRNLNFKPQNSPPRQPKQNFNPSQYFQPS